DGTKAYVANSCLCTAGTKKVVSVIDTADNSFVEHITVGVQPSGVAVSPDGTKAYVTNSGDDTVSVIRTADNTVIDTDAVAGGINGIAVGDVPHTVAFSPDGTKAAVTNSGSTWVGGFRYTLSIIDTTNYNIITTITGLGDRPRGVAFSPDGTKAYVTIRNADFVRVFDTNTYNEITTIAVGNQPLAVAFSPDGTKAFVTNEDDDTVSVIDTTTYNEIATITVGIEPGAVAVSPDGNIAYVTNAQSDTVSVIDLRANAISSDSGDSGGGTDPGIFLNVAGPVGESAPETPIYYGGSNLPGGSQYVLTLSDVCSPSRVIATLAEGTIGVQGSLSSFTRPPPRSPGTYNVRLVVTHSNGLAWQLQSQVTIGASGEYTIISAPVGSRSAAVASPPSSAGCAAAVSSPASASASTPAPVVDPVASAGQCTTSGFGPYVQQADAKPEVLFPSGEKIQLAPGKTLGSSGGDLVNLDVELLEDNAAFEGHCYDVNVASTVVGGENPGSQNVVTLTRAGEIGERFLILTSGELTGVTGSGFRPGTRVDIFLLSEPILLGSVVVYAEGDFSAQVSFIAGRIPSGSHTLQIQGVGYDGVVKIVNTGVWVENTPVVVPEGSVTWWWWLLIAALVIMFIIIFVRRWRNREAIY
ncbi:MAG: beta-propeller fold lactonase family protein, partial [Actinomycetales bacterium]